MIQDNLIKGYYTELKVQETFLKMGFDYSLPAFNISKYDMIVDTGDRLLRIQIKKASLASEGSFQFSCHTTNPVTHAKRTYSKEDCDYFATVWEDKVYLIPIEDINSTVKTLRYKETKTRPDLKVDADQYLIENVFQGYKQLSDNEYYYNTTEGKESALQEKKHNYCKRCGCEISIGRTYCIPCSAFLQRKVEERPERAVLKDLIRTHTFIDVGKMYDVSDNAIRKWCKAVNLPTTKKEINSISEEEWVKI